MTAGRRSSVAAATLPIVPVPQDDELISSWLDRTARFYNQSLGDLLCTTRRSRKQVHLANIDIGKPRAALLPIATLLGIRLEQLEKQTISFAFPWSTKIVARGIYISIGQTQPNLRYAACYHCLEQQKIDHGFSWLRREWVIASRTVCSVHHVMLQEGQGTVIVHPAWRTYLRNHCRAGKSVCAMYPSILGGAPSTRPAAGEGLIDRLHRRTILVQDTLLAAAALGKKARGGSDLDDLGYVVGDLLWAFTRADRHFDDRLVYEAFSSPRLETDWLLGQRRRPGPIDFTFLHVDERHSMLATVALLTGDQVFRESFYHLPCGWQDILATFYRRLKDSDRDEFAGRQRHWPPVFQVDGVGAGAEV